MLLKEKDPTFIQDFRIEGNLSVVNHPTQPGFYGDGSVEVNGTLRTDGLMSATPRSVIYVGSPFNFQTSHTRPTEPPLPGRTQIYSDPQSSGRIVMVNNDGTIIDLNPLQKLGDLMTFDAYKNTTVRLPAGLPGQHLAYDPWTDYKKGLTWTNDYANIGSIDNSDAYARYLELNGAISHRLTQTNLQVSFNDVKRCDTDCFAVSQTDFLILQAGIYEIYYKVTCAFDDPVLDVETFGEEVLPTIVPGCFELSVERSDPSGFSILPGSRVYSSFQAHTLGKPYFSAIGKVVADIPAATRVRILAREFGTQTGLLSTVPTFSSMSVKKMSLGHNSTDSSSYLSTHGVAGARPLLIQDFTVLDVNTILLRTDANDSTTVNSARVSKSGKCKIFGKVVYESNNYAADGTASIETVITVNGTAVQNSGAMCQLLGNEIATSCVVGPIVVDLNTDDVVGLSARLVSKSAADGSINIVSEECCINVELMDNKVWNNLYSISNSSTNLEPSRYKTVAFETEQNGNGTDFKALAGGKTIFTTSGGTIGYFMSAAVQNQDTETFTAAINALCDSGDGYKSIPGSESFVTLLPGHTQTVTLCGTVYVKPNSTIQFSALAVHGGNLLLQDNCGNLLVEKIENTIGVFPGIKNFGRFYKYVEDSELVQSTSTDFVSRLSMSTISLPNGRYRVGLTYEWDMTDPGITLETQLLLDNSIVVESYGTTPLLTGQFVKVTSFKEIQLAPGEHTFNFMTRVSAASQALMTRNVRMELFLS